MPTALVVILAALGVVGSGIGAVLWIKARLGDQVSLSQRDEALKIEAARVSQMEAAAASERVERAKVLDEKSAAVHDAQSAADLLRSQFSRPGGSKAN